MLRKWGLKQKVPRKVHVNTASKDEKKRFSKKKDYRTDICGQAAAAARTRIFTIVSIEESFFFYDSLVGCVWIDKKRPVVRVIGSHQHSLFLVP
jgi:hypothetical protein